MSAVYSALNVFEWIDTFNRDIWSQLDTTTQQALQRRFKTAYSMKEKQVKLPPKSFVIAAAFQAGGRNFQSFRRWFKLIRSYPGKDDKMMKHLTFDQDGWGMIRTCHRTVGIFAMFPPKKAKRYEKLLASSLVYSKSIKLEIVKLIPGLQKNKIKQIIALLKEEADNKAKEWMDYDEVWVKQIEQTQREWEDIVTYWETHIDTHDKNVDAPKNEYLIIDKHGDLTPYGIVRKLNRHIIGQNNALESIATILYYHSKQRQAYLNQNAMEPLQETMLLTGPTGSGKSFIVEQACRLMNIPFVHIDASSFVQSGIVGYGVNDIAKELLRKTNYNTPQAETAVVVLDEIDKLLSNHYGPAVMYQLLRFIEGTDIPIEKSQYDESELRDIRSLSTRHICFILAGSFQNLIDSDDNGIDKLTPWRSLPKPTLHDIERSGFPKELLGRIRDIVTLRPLARDDYRRILLESKHSPITYYRNLLQLSGKDYVPTKHEIEAVIEEAMQLPFGARGLKQVVYQRIYKDRLFNAPGEKDE